MDRTTDTKNALVAKAYRQYATNVQNYFVRYTSDMMKAEDMAQDLFVKLLSYKDMISDETISSFIFSIAKRMVIDDARHQAFVRRATEDYTIKAEKESIWNDPHSLECKQIEETEQARLRTMPQKMAMVYKMTRFEGKTSKELADEMHISKRTVEYHLLMARREIREAVRKVACM